LSDSFDDTLRDATVSAESRPSTIAEPAAAAATLAPLASYGLFGSSPAMRRVMELVQSAAESRAGVLVCGERGTGREMVARALHAHGARPEARFVTVDCAAVPPSSLEQELFGTSSARHEAAFERRLTERITRGSRLYEARRGTLFLEHITDMPARVQAKLVRVLRDGEVVVIGPSGPRSSKPGAIYLDVRVVAAVEPPSCDSAIREGRLRDDLYQRLAGIRIDLPPLHQRRDDIPLLAMHFLGDICRQKNAAPRTLSRSAALLMAALPWRGNALELRALLERLVISAPQHVIRLEDVLAHVRLDGGPVQAGGPATLREARLRFERDYIAAVLQQHHGRVGEAARVLGIQRTNLYRKVRQLKMRRPGGAARQS
jgi:two-component system nitrogen regulation response regulator NtrX